MVHLAPFKKCCFCIDLRYGCLFIVFFELIVELICSILLLIGLFKGSFYKQAVESLKEHFSQEFIEINNETIVMMIFVIAIIVFILLVLCMGFTIVLLIGLHTSKRTPIMVYLVFAWIFFVLMLINFFCLFANLPPAHIMVLHAICLAIFAYFNLVIRSYHKKLLCRA